MKLKEWLARDWDEVENLDFVHPRIRRLAQPLATISHSGVGRLV